MISINFIRLKDGLSLIIGSRLGAFWGGGADHGGSFSARGDKIRGGPQGGAIVFRARKGAAIAHLIDQLMMV